MRAPSNSETQESAGTPPQDPPAGGPPPSPDGGEEEKSPPYNLWFAWSAIGVGLVAYAITIFIFGVKFDSAAATAALGSLLTLIGTVSGAYFGIKNSSDTADKAGKTTKEAQESAKNAVGALDPGKWEELKGKGLL